MELREEEKGGQESDDERIALGSKAETPEWQFTFPLDLWNNMEWKMEDTASATWYPSQAC